MQALREGHTRYTAVTGDAALRQAICKDLEKRKGVRYAAEEIIVGNGAKQEVYQAVLALCRPGDEVIIPAPYWPSYPEIVKLAGATPIILETTASSGFLLDPEALSQAVTPQTRMVRGGSPLLLKSELCELFKSDIESYKVSCTLLLPSRLR